MNSAIVAVAGSGKTERLACAVAKEPHPDRTAVLTFTETNQEEDARRIVQKVDPGSPPARVTGWRAFLLNEIVLPYLPTLYPGIQFNGLASKDPPSFQYLSGPSKYLSRDGRAYPSFLGKLAFEVIKSSRGAAVKRLEDLYDAIYIDEGQDLRGNDLCVLEELLKSRIRISIVLDPRQSTLSTAPRDPKHATKYPFAEVINLYRIWERRGLLEISTENETHRCAPQVALLSDLIFEDSLGLGTTTSNVSPRGNHDGVFVVDKKRLRDYAQEHRALVLAMSESGRFGVREAMNFGKAKGLSRDDVIIFASNPIERLLKNEVRLPPKSACGFYVAVTRARFSVAIAVTNPEKTLEAMNRPGSIWHQLNARLG